MRCFFCKKSAFPMLVGLLFMGLCPGKAFAQWTADSYQTISNDGTHVYTSVVVEGQVIYEGIPPDTAHTYYATNQLGSVGGTISAGPTGDWVSLQNDQSTLISTCDGCTWDSSDEIDCNYAGPFYNDNNSQQVVTATIRQDTFGTVTGDAGTAATNYETLLGTNSLGPIIANGTLNGNPFQGCAVGVETIATINPPDYTGFVTIHRIIDSQGLPVNSTNSVPPGIVPRPPGFDDSSKPAYQTDDPTKSTPPGNVYDLDAPGQGYGADGYIHRYRTNFSTYAVDDTSGMIISAPYIFYVRLSCQYGGSGYQLVYDPSNVPGDNQAASGTTPLTWNLQ